MPLAVFRRALAPLGALGLLLTAARAGDPATPAARTLDAFDDVSTWKPVPSDGVRMTVSNDRGEHGGALRLDFDFQGRAGWVGVRRAFAIPLPGNFRFVFRLRGEGPANTLELKFLDPSGENVWWTRRRAQELPREWTDVVVDRRRLEFAWGPTASKTLATVGAIEVTVSSFAGGKGTLWLDELTFEELPESAMLFARPRLDASASAPGHGPEQAMDGNRETSWETPAGKQWLTVDFGGHRELGGISLDWAPGAHATDYAISTSADGAAWKTLRTVAGGNGGRDDLPMPDAEGRYLRLDLVAGAGTAYALREIEIEPPEFGDSWAPVYRRNARDARRGLYPRPYYDELAYWTLFGVDGDSGKKPLLSEDGAIETPAGFTIEPFLRLDGRLYAWPDVEKSQTLAEGSLPMPEVVWSHPKFALEIAPFAAGTPTEPVLYARYRLRNASSRAARATLLLAVRPLRITAPWQNLNIPDPTAPIDTLAWKDGVLSVNGATAIVPLSPGARAALAAYDAGDASDLLDGPISDAPREIRDPQRHASAVLAWNADIPAGAARDVLAAIPLHADDSGRAVVPRLAALGDRAAAEVEAGRAETASHWRAVAEHVAIDLPAATDLVETARANVGFVLAARDGPALRGGPRNYDRSWIRDGALTSTVLLRFGFADEVARYIRWFVGYQYPDGKVPCCVDDRGADPVPEHDSHGELVYLVAEYARLTGDMALPREVWPHVEAAIGYIDRLRVERRTAAYRAPALRHFFGLLPESISHEGYSAKPMHSYWDDFWALRGLRDAAWLAERLGLRDAAARIARSRDEFENDLLESLRRAMALHRIAYIPGCADLGDFDPTSTTIALDPGGELSRLPREAVRATFDRYWEDAAARMEGRKSWDLYTPYEVRTVGTFVRLGERERALRLLQWFLDDRRPLGWKAWAEVVARDPRAAISIGDMPHLWVASDYVRAFVDLLAYEREEDGALVLAAGVPEDWLPKGVAVRRLATAWGPLDFSMRRDGSRIVARIGGGLRVPPGGVVLAPPGSATRAIVDGKPAAVESGRVIVRALPADVEIQSD